MPLRRGNAVEMDADHKIGLRFINKIGTLHEILGFALAISLGAGRSQILVLLTGHNDYCSRLLQIIPQMHGNGQVDIFFVHTRLAGGSSVRPSMPCIHGDHLAGQGHGPVIPGFTVGKLIAQHKNGQQRQSGSRTQLQQTLFVGPNYEPFPSPSAHQKNPPRIQ
ncbi:hypothetical protein D3C75_1017350 [compost metagenome]